MTTQEALDLMRWNIHEYFKRDIRQDKLKVIVHPHLQRELFHNFYYAGHIVGINPAGGPEKMTVMGVPIISSYEFEKDQIEVVVNLFK